jgi:hypothetical protein
MSTDHVVREQLLALLQGKQAHMTFDEAIKVLPLKARRRA